ncbi:deoxyribonuclease IV [Thalassobacillus pellis]|uniref:deoxyribonuclease IV n=1 Tax=Thalassobacillus pellis TaxID=748008 RepID=UPI001962266E|nr:deoxyribonuclease-4 [Thalassobacillus pellis]
MRFGSHVSIQEGYLGAAKQANALNASAFQYFPKNPRSLSVKEYNQEDAIQCQTFCVQNELLSIAHTPYPTTLTPTDEKKKQMVIASLLNDLEIAELCGSLGVVVHFGKQVFRSDQLASYRLMIEVLNEVLGRWEGKCKILIENLAGKPGTMGTTFEELVRIRELSDYADKIGFCFDTCHAFASGLWDGDNWEVLYEKGVELGYINYLEAVHLNNSKYESGSGKDRHANIFGPGHISENQFEELLGSELFSEIPFILETPKEHVPHKKEIQQLKEKWGS